MKVTLLDNVSESSASDFGMTKEQFEELLDHVGETAVVDCVACEVDGTFEHDYHDITFEDGYEVEAISGYHLEKV